VSPILRAYRPHPTTPCDRCRFYARSAFLCCAPHPSGPPALPCPDFESNDLWQPEDLSPYDAIFREWYGQHPLFTGRCPDCRTPFPRNQLPPRRWRCRICGWSEADEYNELA